MNVFELFATITLDSGDYEKQLGEASSKTSGFGEKLKSGLATAGKVAAAGLAVATTAVVALGKAAIDGFAEYEQLVGGVETLFGAGGKSIEEYAASVGKTVSEVSAEYEKLMASQQLAMDNAAKAYATAGLSANEYMSTVTSFSASLLQSLGGDTEAAAKYADQAITDMADNANKMGSSMESIQNAYQGFAKQNYTMLDNLKLGYGGTKDEMERLLKDAEKIAGVEFDISSYADVVEAIHVIQTEMGITGTTAAEAAGTISGSAAAMKAAWENLIVGIADDSQDFDQLIENLVTSVTTFGDNILPRISVALGGVVNLITGLAPVLTEAIPPLIEQVVPQLLSGAESILSALASSLPGIVASIADVIGGQSHAFIQAGLDLVLAVADGLMQSIPSLAGAAAEVVSALAMWFVEYADVLMDTGVALIGTIAEALVENLPTLIPIAVEAVLLIAATLTDPGNLMALLDAAIAILGALAEGLINSLPILLEKAPEIISNLVTALANGAVKMVEAAAKLIGSLATGIVDNLPEIGEAAANIIETVINAVVNLDAKLKEVGNNIVMGVWNGISAKVAWFTEKVTGFFKGIVDGVKDALGIHSPSRVFAEIGGFMAEGLGIGWDAKYSSIKKQIEDGMAFDAKTVDFDVSTDDPVRSRGVHVIQNIYSEAKTAADLMQEAIYQQERAVYLGV